MGETLAWKCPTTFFLQNSICCGNSNSSSHFKPGQLQALDIQLECHACERRFSKFTGVVRAGFHLNYLEKCLAWPTICFQWVFFGREVCTCVCMCVCSCIRLKGTYTHTYTHSHDLHSRRKHLAP